LLSKQEPGQKILFPGAGSVAKVFLLFCILLITMPAYEQQKKKSFENDGKVKVCSTQPESRQTRTKTVTLSNSVQLDLVWIPPGEFNMGSPKSEKGRQRDEVYHSVTISKGFWMSKYEVTQAQWQAVTGNNSSDFINNDNVRIRKQTSVQVADSAASRGRGSLPVDSVSYNDVQDFIKRLNRQTAMIFRLPTEAEWEYACRAGTTTPFHYGDSLSSAMANFDGRHPYNAAKGVFRGETVPVGSFKPNAFGLYDMHGNIWEWCRDWYGPYSPKPVTDPVGPKSGVYRVLRGGCWFGDGNYCRSAYRDKGFPDKRVGLIGFRLVLPQAAVKHTKQTGTVSGVQKETPQ